MLDANSINSRLSAKINLSSEEKEAIQANPGMFTYEDAAVQERLDDNKNIVQGLGNDFKQITNTKLLGHLVLIFLIVSLALIDTGLTRYPYDTEKIANLNIINNVDPSATGTLLEMNTDNSKTSINELSGLTQTQISSLIFNNKTVFKSVHLNESKNAYWIALKNNEVILLNNNNDNDDQQSNFNNQKEMIVFISSHGKIFSKTSDIIFEPKGVLIDHTLKNIYQPVFKEFPLGALLYKIGANDLWKPYLENCTKLIAHNNEIVELMINLKVSDDQNLNGSYSIRITTDQSVTNQ